MAAEYDSGADEVTSEFERPDGREPDRRDAGIWGLLGVVLLVAIALLLLLTQCVPRVPDVVGLTESQAVAKLSRAGYQVGAVSRLELPKAPAGKVAEQAPPANAVFAHGKTVDLVIALGADLTKVPDVLGNDTSRAELLIKGSHLTMAVSGQYSATTPPGAVISQSPTAGTRVPAGTQVMLAVSLGIEPETGGSSGKAAGDGAGASGGDGTGSTGSGSTEPYCPASYPAASVWASGGDIFIRLAPGDTPRQLTGDSQWDTKPMLSPNGKYVVFMRGASSTAKSTGIGRVCLTDFGVTMLNLPMTSLSPKPTIYYGTPRFAPSPTGTTSDSDWLVTPQYMSDDPSSRPGIGGRLLVTNVPSDTTWVSWNVAFRPTKGMTLSRSPRAGCIRVSQVDKSGPTAVQDFNAYTGKYFH